MQVMKETKLAEDSKEKMNLIGQLQSFVVRLEDEMKQSMDDVKLIGQNSQRIERLKLRVGLIHKCNEFSFLRLNHLEQIFKYYCTHVFRTGKYMTFERLEYEKIHMTIERFFLFLKDFQLTSANIDNKIREVIEKQYIITVFKKISSNSKELSFEQFVQSLEKLGVMFWNEKEGYHRKQKEQERQKQRRRRLLQKRNLKKQGLLAQNNPNKSEDEKQQLNEQGQQQNENNEEPPAKPNNNSNENDALIDDLINNQDIEDPNEQVNSIANQARKENQQVNQNIKEKQDMELSLLKLTMDEKIENYYQLLDIDSLDNYKHKLTSLNLLSFQINEHHNTVKESKAMSASKLEAVQAEEQRLKKLKAKMNQKKEKMKEKPLPKPTNQRALKEQQNSKRRKELKKERQNAVKQIKTIEVQKKEAKQKFVPPSKLQYKESEVSWDTIQRLNIEHLKLKQFNPNKLYAAHDDDNYFLHQYGTKPRMSSRLQARERQSLSVVQSTKMRAEQLEKKQKEQVAQVRKKVQNTSVSRNKI